MATDRRHATIDILGHVALIDRLKDLIKSGGGRIESVKACAGLDGYDERG
jgi:acyl-CoA synthetase (AMP-forming)/AMP-acid ligase II